MNLSKSLLSLALAVGSSANAFSQQGPTTFDSLKVIGKTEIQDELDVYRDVHMKDSLKIDKNLDVQGKTKVKGEMIVKGDTKLKGKTTMIGKSVMKDNVVVHGDVKIKSLEDISQTDNRFALIKPNGKITVASNVKSTSAYALDIDGDIITDGKSFLSDEVTLKYMELLTAQGPRMVTIDAQGKMYPGVEFDPIILDNEYSKDCGRPVLPWLKTNTNDIMLCYNYSNVGIGTNDPQFRLDVKGDGNISSTLFSGELNVNSGVLFADTKVGVGTTTPVTMLHVKQDASSNVFPDVLAVFQNENDSRIMLATDLGIGAYSAMTRAGDAGIFATPNGDNSTTGASGLVLAVAKGGQANGIRIDESGLVQIGTREKPTSGNYKLAVNGKILALELEILSFSDWPDYVFDESYQLPTLAEVESFINEYGHLPNVPSAEEVQEKGVGVGEMNRILLQKVEELTLYIIQLEKKVDELESKK